MNRRRSGFKEALRRFIENNFPRKGDNAREISRKCILIVSFVVMICGVCYLASYFIGSYKNRLESDRLRTIHSGAVSASVSISASSGSPACGIAILPELEPFLSANTETVGWISIPNTNIDYPVVQTIDNEKYLKTGFNLKANRDGAIFLDYRDRIRPLSRNLIIYGHNMKDGRMFCDLTKYERGSGNDYVGFYNSSPIIKFDTLYEHYIWKIFAVFVTAADSKYKGALYYLDTDFASDDEFNNFISEVRKRSFINTNVDVRPDDNILTLSTCDYVYPSSPDGDHARLVVMARKLRDGESTTVEPAVKNEDVLFPDFYYGVWKTEKSRQK